MVLLCAVVVIVLSTSFIILKVFSLKISEVYFASVIFGPIPFTVI